MRFIIVLFFILILNSCSLIKVKNDFSGNWFTCGRDGTYYELLIKENLFKYSTSKGLVTGWYKFKISGDTLSYNDPYLYKDSVIVVKSIFRFTIEDEMTLDYITSDEQWTFHRIKEAILDIDNNDKLIISTHERGNKVQCIDKRTNEEKKQDSLVKYIYFQF